MYVEHFVDDLIRPLTHIPMLALASSAADILMTIVIIGGKKDRMTSGMHVGCLIYVKHRGIYG